MDIIKNNNIKKVDKLRINAYILDLAGILDNLQVLNPFKRGTP